MKLLFALPGFHKYHRGAEVALLAVASELSRMGDEVTVVGSGAPEASTDYRFVRVPSIAREVFERFPTFPPLRSETAWEDMAFAANVIRQVGLEPFDATITCSFPFTHWALRRSGSNGPKHFFVTQNGDWPAYSNKSEYRYFSCDGLICTNPDYFDRNRGRWNCSLVPNGADLRRFRPGAGHRARYGLPEDKKIVLMVSAFIATKRVEDAVRAIAKMEDTYLVVAGDGPLRDQVEELAREVLPNRFKRITLSAEEMPGLYNSADAFLHLSLLESFGNVFVEAMATGLPVVGHDTERLRWIVGDNEFLGDTENADQLIGLIKQALHREPTELNSNLERFAWPTIAKQYRQFIGGTIASASS